MLKANSQYSCQHYIKIMYYHIHDSYERLIAQIKRECFPKSACRCNVEGGHDVIVIASLFVKRSINMSTY
ncbi:hypothetical protein MHIR_DE00358 [Candidatus Doolittlea endobia]|uniref:Uncharacterized protein n=1 Tax=Candidatus Doolittlea endobia TaxID=1778262 RepID=A0A143WUR6_9ENTR|nr:hypothetical protein MHIR_DE00358 [Candidatus Doolittlea endobia]